VEVEVGEEVEGEEEEESQVVEEEGELGVVEEEGELGVVEEEGEEGVVEEEGEEGVFEEEGEDVGGEVHPDEDVGEAVLPVPPRCALPILIEDGVVMPVPHEDFDKFSDDDPDADDGDDRPTAPPPITDFPTTEESIANYEAEKAANEKKASTSRKITSHFKGMRSAILETVRVANELQVC
jgi:hypothetical protein